MGLAEGAQRAVESEDEREAARFAEIELFVDPAPEQRSEHLVRRVANHHANAMRHGQLVDLVVEGHALARRLARHAEDDVHAGGGVLRAAAKPSLKAHSAGHA